MYIKFIGGKLLKNVDIGISKHYLFAAGDCVFDNSRSCGENLYSCNYKNRIASTVLLYGIFDKGFKTVAGKFSTLNNGSRVIVFCIRGS